MMTLTKHNRIRERELARIHLEFASVVMAFESRMETNNFKTQNEHDLIVEKFNDIWLKFCSHWNSFDHIVQPNPFAFQNYLVNSFHVKIYDE